MLGIARAAGEAGQDGLQLLARRGRLGSFFYGSILGVFALALWPRASGTGAFVGLLAGMSAVAAVAIGQPQISFLWHNVVVAVAVFGVGIGVSWLAPTPRRERSQARATGVE